VKPPLRNHGKDSKDHWIAKTHKLSGQKGCLPPLSCLATNRGGRPPFLTRSTASGSGPDFGAKRIVLCLINALKLITFLLIVPVAGSGLAQEARVSQRPGCCNHAALE